jgi:hypothetical protein
MNMPAPDDLPERRSQCRRRRPTGPWDALWTPARRRAHRRADEDDLHGCVDRHGAGTAALAIALLLLTLADGAITLILLTDRFEEANPVMAPLVEQGALPFLLGKYALTAAGLPVLLAFKDHRLFRTGFRVKYLLPTFVGLYLALLSYQMTLLRSSDANPAAKAPTPGRQP